MRHLKTGIRRGRKTTHGGRWSAPKARRGTAARSTTRASRETAEIRGLLRFCAAAERVAVAGRRAAVSLGQLGAAVGRVREAC
jgi:hypothetical protein